MKTKKILIIVGVIALILVVFGESGKKRKKEEVEEISLPTGVLPFEMRKVETIRWEIKDQKTERKMKVYEIEKRLINEKEIELNPVYLDKETGRVIFSEDIRRKSQLAVEKKISEAEIKSKFYEVMSKIKVNDLEARIEKINYLGFRYPQWEESTKDKADAVEIKASWYWQGYPIENFEGYPIRAIFSMDGKLLKLEADLKIGEIKETGEVEIMGLEEIKTIAVENFKVWMAKPSSNELKIEPETISKITATGVRLGYMIEETKLVPYYFIEGLDETVLIVPAKKE